VEAHERTSAAHQHVDEDPTQKWWSSMNLVGEMNTVDPPPVPEDMLVGTFNDDPPVLVVVSPVPGNTPVAPEAVVPSAAAPP